MSTTIRLAPVTNVPTPDQIREALLSEIHRTNTRGIKGFAEDNGFPYDRVRDHLRNESAMTVQALFEYMSALGLDMDRLMKIIDAATI